MVLLTQWEIWCVVIDETFWELILINQCTNIWEALLWKIPSTHHFCYVLIPAWAAWQPTNMPGLSMLISECRDGRDGNVKKIAEGGEGMNCLKRNSLKQSDSKGKKNQMQRKREIQSEKVRVDWNCLSAFKSQSPTKSHALAPESWDSGSQQHLLKVRMQPLQSSNVTKPSPILYGTSFLILFYQLLSSFACLL